MEITCRFCGFSTFRTSRFRFKKSDLGHLLLLRLPARCRNCDERTFVPLRLFLSLHRAHKERLKEHPSTK
jgi:hypothetical protein